MRILVTGQTDLTLLADLLDEPGPRGMGGIPTAHEVRLLVERGHEVTVVTLDPTITDEVVLRGDRLTVHVGPCRAQHGIRDLYRTERAYLVQTIMTVRPDVVHAHWTYEYALAALDTGLPVTVTIHDAPLRIVRWNLPWHGTGSVKRRLARTTHWVLRASMAWRVARRSKFNIAVSPHARDHFRKVLRARGETVVIPNLLGSELWTESDRLDVRDPMQKVRPFRCVAVLGTWGGLKNATTLLRSFALVRATRTDVRLSLIGVDFGIGGIAERWARRHGLTDGIDFIGPITNAEVAKVLRSADLLVHPSREEACGMVITEAQMALTAVLGGFDSGGVSWALGYGTAGELVDVGSAEQLAAEMTALLDDAGRRAELARAGRALAERRHAPTRVMQATEDMLRRASADRGAPGWRYR